MEIGSGYLLVLLNSVKVLFMQPLFCIECLFDCVELGVFVENASGVCALFHSDSRLSLPLSRYAAGASALPMIVHINKRCRDKVYLSLEMMTISDVFV